MRLTYCGLVVLLAHATIADEPDRGPPFPRIANVYGTAFTKNGTSFHGDKRTLEEAARYDLLVGVQRRLGNDPDGKAFRAHLGKLKKINPHLIALSPSSEFVGPTWVGRFGDPATRLRNTDLLDQDTSFGSLQACTIRYPDARRQFSQTT